MLGIRSIPSSSSNSTWKPTDSDKFPTGLRVLVVDDDPTCLKILEKMLKTCSYNVTKCSRADEALTTLRKHKHGFDVVISDVHMPDIDGFKLLECIGLEMDLPVIMMSADDGKNVVMKGITHGACDYLIKPVRMEALKNIWQHVLRKNLNGGKGVEQCGSAEGGEKQPKPPEDADYSPSANENNWRSSKKQKDEEEEGEERDDNTTLKKPRVVWSVELHQQFVGAVNQLGVEKAVPKKILELMNVPGLTRENVASHLQKYRLYLRRLSGQSNTCQQEATYGPILSLSGLDFQALAASGQLTAKSLASLQAAGLGPLAAKSGIPVSLVYQSNLFSSENPVVKFGDIQQHSNSSKQIDLLHGIPTSMDSKQLANFPPAAQSLGGMMNVSVSTQGGQRGPPMLVHMSQSRSAGQLLGEATGSHVTRLPKSMGQPNICSTFSNGFVVRNGLGENDRGACYPAAQSPSMLNFPLNDSVELPGSGFPLGSPPAISSHTSKGTFQEDITSTKKGAGGFNPTYDAFSDPHQQTPNNWDFQSAGLNFTPFLQPASLLRNVDIRPNFAANQLYSSSSNGENGNVACVTRPFNPIENASSSLTPYVAGHLNTASSHHSVRIKSESAVYPESIVQEDLMNALFKQQPIGIGQSENDFDFEGYRMDNIPV